jgi:hypothetical protein
MDLPNVNCRFQGLARFQTQMGCKRELAIGHKSENPFWRHAHFNEAPGAADAAAWMCRTLVPAKVRVTRRFPATHLRQIMLDELQRRNYSPNTVREGIPVMEIRCGLTALFLRDDVGLLAR